VSLIPIIAAAAALTVPVQPPQPGLNWTLVYEVQTEKNEGDNHQKGTGRSEFRISLKLAEGKRILLVDPQAPAKPQPTVELEVDEALQPLRIVNWATLLADARARLEAMSLTGSMLEHAKATMAAATPETAAHTVSPALDLLAGAQARAQGRSLPSEVPGSWTTAEPTPGRLRLTWTREDQGVPITTEVREQLRKISGKPETVDSLPQTSGAGRQTCTFDVERVVGLVLAATCDADVSTVYANGGGSGVGRQRSHITITQTLPESR